MIDLGVGCLAAVFCFVFIVQPQAVDPVIYLEAAQDFLGSSLNHWTARIGIVIPVSLFSMLFGYSEAAYYAVPLIAAFGFGYATSMLGRYIMAPRVGIAAAAMAISGPIVLPFATLLMPDVGAAALLTVSFGLLIKAAGAEAPNSRLLILSGSVFGAAYLVREFALIFLPALILAAVVLRLRWASIAKLLAGMVLAPLVESIVGLIAWGEPLPRLTSLMGVLSREAADSPGILGRGLSAQSTPWSSFMILVKLLGSHWYGRALLLGSSAFVAIAAVTRSRRRLALVVYTLVPWVTLAVVGAMRVGPTGDRLVILLVVERYWAAFLPPLAVATAVTIFSAAAWLRERSVMRPRSFLVWEREGAWLVVSAVVVLAVSASIAELGSTFVRFGGDEYWEFRSTLRELPEDARVIVPRRYADVLRLYANEPFGGPVKGGEVVPAAAGDPVSGNQWLLIHTNDGRPQGSEGAGPLLLSPPASYSVFAAEQPFGSWVLLEPDRTRPGKEETVVSIGADEDSAVTWRAIYVKDDVWGPARTLGDKVDVSEGDTLYAFDGPAAYGTRPVSGAAVEEGALLEVRVKLTLTDGRPSLTCQFYTGSGPMERVDVPSLTLVTSGAFDDDLVGFCRAPREGGPFLLRPVVSVSGPGELELGPARAIWHVGR